MTKLIAKILLLVILLGSCFAFVGCSYLFRPRWFKMNTKFSVTIEGVKQQKEIDFEIARSYYFDIKLFGDVDVGDDTYKDIQMEYNEENTVVTYAYDSPRSKSVTFKIYFYEFSFKSVSSICKF